MAIRFPPSARVTNTPHRDRCGRECTRDAIFLLQRRRLMLHSIPDYLNSVDSEYLEVKEKDDVPDWLLHSIEKEDDVGEQRWTIGMDAFIQAAYSAGAESDDGSSLVTQHFETESVWLDRDEAERWAAAKSHRFPEGWRVYSVCAEGKLAKLLRTQDGE